MKHRKLRSTLVLFVELMLLCVLSGYASAEIIDDISLKTDINGEVDAVIKFSVPIQYLRHFPQRKSPSFSIYFNILGNVPRDEWQNYESHRSPPSDIVRGFVVTTRDLNTGPKIEVQFIRPAEFSVSAGKDGQTILLHIKPDVVQQKKEDKPAEQSGGGATSVPLAVAVAPPVIAPSIAATTPKVTPAAVPTTVTATPAAVPVQPPVTASKPAAVPAQTPVATSRPAAPVQEKSAISKPSVVLPTASTKLVPQLGGKDGLPFFPEIEKVAQGATTAQPSEPLTPADQAKKADTQAAVMMAKGRDALLAGEMFSAIEAFNNTLRLPPNKYSQDAQVWIGIAREKAGQLAKAKLEYESYLKLYPNGTATVWVKDRLAKLKAIQPYMPIYAQQPVPSKGQDADFQTTQYGSVSMYYYHGNSQTDTVTTIAGVESPTRLNATDQSSLISNVSATARFYNNEYDNRLVFQDYEAFNFLPGQKNQNRLNAAYFEVKNRVINYSARIGRQSALGGGVLGRFDGVSAGYGVTPNWRANIVAGRLADLTVGPKPVFTGASLDFGVRSQLGGSVYVISQKVEGMIDRKAVGGNLRYFEQGKTAMAMLDYDMQFKELNMLTLQGTLNYDSVTDINFLLDRRKTPVLSIRSAVNGGSHIWAVQNVDPVTGLPLTPPSFTNNVAPSTINELLQNGWTKDDLIALAKLRTAVSNVAQIGVTKRIKDRWQVGGDIVVSNTSGMPESGFMNLDGTTGLEGFSAATPSTGNVWALTGRLSGSDVIFKSDMSMCSLSYNKSKFTTGQMLMLYNHANIRELWTVDTTLRQYWQTDNLGGKTSTTAPALKLGYRLRSSITLEVEGGLDLTKVSPAAFQSSKTTRAYYSLGFRWDF